VSQRKPKSKDWREIGGNDGIVLKLLGEELAEDIQKEKTKLTTASLPPPQPPRKEEKKSRIVKQGKILYRMEE